jgi:hypothetical protein
MGLKEEITQLPFGATPIDDISGLLFDYFYSARQESWKDRSGLRIKNRINFNEKNINNRWRYLWT